MSGVCWVPCRVPPIAPERFCELEISVQYPFRARENLNFLELEKNDTVGLFSTWSTTSLLEGLRRD